ncbi:MAG: response regulator transcription factor [Campylobacteraceae bacterium]|nr:response regulator transcription factor [Campylobacteraceae bacterium]
MKILLLEDDYTYKESIKEFLEEMGYEVDDFENGQNALDAIYEKSYDLLLLDIRVPEIDGYEILKTVRKAKIDVPIIFITSLTDINNLSLGYELGCNDYIRKPFSLKELKYRVSQTISSYHLHTTLESISLQDGYSYTIANSALSYHGDDIMLSSYEKKLIFLLVKNRGNFISVETIKDYVWDGREVGDTDIRMAIKKIRDKTDKTLILTAKGIGYKIEK